MKYTIELTNKQKAQMDCMIDIVHRYVGFNPKLEPMTEDTIITTGKEIKELYDSTYDIAYNTGINDLAHAMKVYFPLNSEERLKHFGINIATDNFAVNNPRRLIDMAKAYEEKKKAEIRVGDVVKFNEKCHNYDHVKSREFLVLHIFDNGLVTILYDNGDTGAAEMSLLDKTGRHIDEVEQLLDKLRGDENEKN